MTPSPRGPPLPKPGEEFPGVQVHRSVRTAGESSSSSEALRPLLTEATSVRCAGLTALGLKATTTERGVTATGWRGRAPRPPVAAVRELGRARGTRSGSSGVREARRGQGFCAADVARAETAVPRAASRTPRLTAPGAAREAEPTQRRAPAPATPNVPAGCGGRQGDRTRSPNGPARIP